MKDSLGSTVTRKRNYVCVCSNRQDKW